jgi:hypothetical protein
MAQQIANHSLRGLSVRLTALVQVGCPVIEVLRPADEFARIDDGIGVESGEEELPVEAIDAATEPYQAIEDVLAVEELVEPGEPMRVEVQRSCHVRHALLGAAAISKL